MHVDGRLDRLRPAREVPARHGDEPAAAHRLGDHPLAPDQCGFRLPLREEQCRLLDATDLEKHLDMVGSPETHARLVLADRIGCALGEGEVLQRGHRRPAPGIAHREGLVKELELSSQAQPECAPRAFPRDLDLTPVKGEERGRKAIVGSPGFVLDADLLHVVDIAARDVPTARHDLDDREVPVELRAQTVVAIAPLLESALQPVACRLRAPLPRQHERQRPDRPNGIPRVTHLRREPVRLFRERQCQRIAPGEPQHGEDPECAGAEAIVVETLREPQRCPRVPLAPGEAP